jgi:ribosomal protein L30E
MFGARYVADATGGQQVKLLVASGCGLRTRKKLHYYPKLSMVVVRF